IPSFLARIAGIVLAERQPDLDVDARGQMVEPLERVDGLGRRLMDVDQPLVRPDLEVLLGVLVLEGRADHRVAVLLRRQRHGTGNRRAGARGGLHDLLRSRLYGRRVVGLEADSNFVLLGCCHVSFCALKAGLVAPGPAPMVVSVDFGPAGLLARRGYLMTSVTTPEPTVRPPSRIAKRRPASMAIGWISSMLICTLSPGMTISV